MAYNDGWKHRRPRRSERDIDSPVTWRSVYFFAAIYFGIMGLLNLLSGGLLFMLIDFALAGWFVWILRSNPKYPRDHDATRRKRDW